MFYYIYTIHVEYMFDIYTSIHYEVITRVMTSARDLFVAWKDSGGSFSSRVEAQSLSKLRASRPSSAQICCRSSSSASRARHSRGAMLRT